MCCPRGQIWPQRGYPCKINKYISLNLSSLYKKYPFTLYIYPYSHYTQLEDPCGLVQQPGIHFCVNLRKQFTNSSFLEKISSNFFFSSLVSEIKEIFFRNDFYINHLCIYYVKVYLNKILRLLFASQKILV